MTEVKESRFVAFVKRWRVFLLTMAGITVATAVAGVAGYVSWGHIVAVSRTHGESAAAWIPVSVDGTMLAGTVMAAVDRIRGYKPRVWSLIGLWLGSFGTVAFNIASAIGRDWVAMIIAAVPAVALLVTVETLFHPSQRLLKVAKDAIVEASTVVKATVADATTQAAIPPVSVSATVPMFSAPGAATEPAPVAPAPAPKPRTSGKRKPTDPGLNDQGSHQAPRRGPGRPRKETRPAIEARVIETPDTRDTDMAPASEAMVGT